MHTLQKVAGRWEVGHYATGAWVMIVSIEKFDEACRMVSYLNGGAPVNMNFV